MPVAVTTATCAALAAQLGEPLAGTAPHAPTWLLVEHPGPWRRDALDPGPLPEPVVAHLREQAARHGLRVQLIRRHGRGPAPDGYTVALANVRPGARWLETRRIADHRELSTLDLEAARSPTAPGWGQPVVEGWVLVCTHGRRDRCCAERGRPVAAAVAAAVGHRAWETTHTGGHRFAANLVALPAGVVLGRLLPEEVTAVLAALEQCRVPVERLRGLACYPPAVQAADVAARRRWGVAELDGVHVVDVREEADTIRVAVAVDGTTAELRVRAREADPPRPVSCGAEPTAPVAFEVE